MYIPSKREDSVEFCDGQRALIFADRFNELYICYLNIVKDETITITKEDYDLFIELDKLYKRILKTHELCDIQRKKDIVLDDKIVVKDSAKRGKSTMCLEKVDDDSFKFSFNFIDNDNKLMMIETDPLKNKNMFYQYIDLFKDFYERLREIDFEYHQINLDEYEYTLRMKK